MAGKNTEDKKIKYLMFCNECGLPKIVPEYIIISYFVTEVPGIYCETCNHLNPIPDYLKKISGEL